MINKIENYLDELFPNPKCEINYSNEYELLINIMLSAQTTDKRVNIVTKELYEKYNSLIALSEADINDLKRIIHSLGNYNKKSEYIKEISTILVNKYNGKTTGPDAPAYRFCSFLYILLPASI